ncbi:hypothetical protein ACFFQF_07330 [Haladaptatus pallidirubidus]|uniref:Uncharacterized protein n=1 Tax=Haladaptatus pallidirubidus TaxID=1008152 RepID=A0AAV3UMD7_9EURY
MVTSAWRPGFVADAFQSTTERLLPREVEFPFSSLQAFEHFVVVDADAYLPTHDSAYRRVRYNPLG